VVNAEPRSLTKTKTGSPAGAGATPGAHRHGSVLGVPFLTRRTCTTAPLKSTWSQRRSQTSAARRPCGGSWWRRGDRSGFPGSLDQGFDLPVGQVLAGPQLGCSSDLLGTAAGCPLRQEFSGSCVTVVFNFAQTPVNRDGTTRGQCSIGSAFVMPAYRIYKPLAQGHVARPALVLIRRGWTP
jgi:hypothetical protein